MRRAREPSLKIAGCGHVGKRGCFRLRHTFHLPALHPYGRARSCGQARPFSISLCLPSSLAHAFADGRGCFRLRHTPLIPRSRSCERSRRLCPVRSSGGKPFEPSALGGRCGGREPSPENRRAYMRRWYKSSGGETPGVTVRARVVAASAPRQMPRLPRLPASPKVVSPPAEAAFCVVFCSLVRIWAFRRQEPLFSQNPLPRRRP